MTAINSADCEWKYVDSHREWDINGDLVVDIPIEICVTPGHGGHTRPRL
jgi:hypothetical protein